jgi:putative tryptophan/tyrosine transport system substrate-binding protein
MLRNCLPSSQRFKHGLTAIQKRREGMTSVDPVAAGLVIAWRGQTEISRGSLRLTRDLSGKRLELLKEAVPGISRVPCLWESTFGSKNALQEYEAAAHDLKIPLQSLEVRGPNPDFEGAFEAAAEGRVNALITKTNAGSDVIRNGLQT